MANIVYLLSGKIIICDVNEKTGMVDEKTFNEVIMKCKRKELNQIFLLQFITLAMC